MKIIHCPINGPRPAQEFVFGGEFRLPPENADENVSDLEWADYVFNRNGEPGIKKEWWYHIASGVWFLAERDNVTDRIIRTYLYDEESKSNQAPATATR